MNGGSGAGRLAGGELALDGLHLRRLTAGRCGSRCRLARLADTQLREDLRLDLLRDVRVLREELAGVLLALPELIALVGVPGAGLADDVVLDTEVDEAALAGDADAVEDVELRLLERRRHLVLHDLDAGAVSDRIRAVLQRLDPADVQAHRRVELQ